MQNPPDFAIVVPMANESGDFQPFADVLTAVLDKIGGGRVYFVVDEVSRDNTLDLCRELADRDPRYSVVWAPENTCVVDAYLRGYTVAFQGGHDIILELDAGLSHDPRAIPMFLRVLNEGNDCAFGSRFINGGSIQHSRLNRTFLSKAGTLLANVLLGTRMYDMTSGFQGFHASVVGQFINHRLLSTGHFYQTELRYLLRRRRYAEIPIHYRMPSNSVSGNSVKNSLSVLLHYFSLRVRGRASEIPEMGEEQSYALPHSAEEPLNEPPERRTR